MLLALCSVTGARALAIKTKITHTHTHTSTDPRLHGGKSPGQLPGEACRCLQHLPPGAIRRFSRRGEAPRPPRRAGRGQFAVVHDPRGRPADGVLDVRTAGGSTQRRRRHFFFFDRVRGAGVGDSEPDDTPHGGGGGGAHVGARGGVVAGPRAQGEALVCEGFGRAAQEQGYVIMSI